MAYGELPLKCPHCRQMPVSDETVPKWMIREYGSCYCDHEAYTLVPVKEE